MPPKTSSRTPSKAPSKMSPTGSDEPEVELPRPPTPEEQRIIELKEKLDLLKKGLPIDWLVRAQKVVNMETMVYLSQLQKTWSNASPKIVTKILKDHESKKGGTINANEPPPISYRRRSHDGPSDCQEVVEFTKRLLGLIKNETAIWDKNDERHGFHRPMRKAWFNVSLRLGGWGTIQHVQMLKSIYRRKRDQYNSEYMRSQKPFPYADDMAFLSDVVERHTVHDQSKREVPISDYVKSFKPTIKYEVELANAPDELAQILLTTEAIINDVTTKFGDEALAELLTTSVNEVLKYREKKAMQGLSDNEWNNESPVKFEVDDDEPIAEVYEEEYVEDVKEPRKGAKGKSDAKKGSNKTPRRRSAAVPIIGSAKRIRAKPRSFKQEVVEDSYEMQEHVLTRFIKSEVLGHYEQDTNDVGFAAENEPVLVLPVQDDDVQRSIDVLVKGEDGKEKENQTKRKHDEADTGMPVLTPLKKVKYEVEEVIDDDEEDDDDPSKVVVEYVNASGPFVYECATIQEIE